MAENKKKSQYTVIGKDDITEATKFDLIAEVDGDMTNLTVPYGTETTGLLGKLKEDIEQTFTELVIPANSSNVVNMGLASVYGYCEIVYFAKRGTKERGGRVSVLNTGVYNLATEIPGIDSENPSGWLDYEMYLAASAQVRVQFNTDNSDVNDTTINYRIITQIQKTIS